MAIYSEDTIELEQIGYIEYTKHHPYTLNQSIQQHIFVQNIFLSTFFFEMDYQNCQTKSTI